MAASNLNLGKASGGVLNIQPADGTTNTSLVLPSSGVVVATDVAVTDNAIVRYDGTTGKVQNSGVVIDDNNSVTTTGYIKSVYSQIAGNGFTGTYATDASGIYTDVGNTNYRIYTGGSERMRIDSAGNVGIGTVPNIITAGYKTLQIHGNAGVSLMSSSNDSHLSTNTYYNGGYLYQTTGVQATDYVQAGGNHYWKTAAPGTAGHAITWTNAMTLDASGSLGIGVTPYAWFASTYKTIDLGDSGSISGYYGSGTKGVLLAGNTFRTVSGNWIYKTSQGANLFDSSNGQFNWLTAPAGTAGNAITWNTAMTLDSNGNLNVGVSGSNCHNFRKNVTLNAGNPIFEIAESGSGNGWSAFIAYGVGAFGANSANSAVRIGKDAITSRSINAGGTINASGADYAEYEYSNDITLVKGQIVGFKADGTLTDKYSESIRFAIKSTNPSIVGGDTWGIEEIVGKRPEQPVKTEEMTDEEFAKLEEQYEKDLADFEVRLETERQKVDRIAYAGKVPVNVYGAVAGQYVIAIEKEDGTIDGKLVNKVDMTFSEYQDAVGRVNKILDDGRAEVAVIIH